MTFYTRPSIQDRAIGPLGAKALAMLLAVIASAGEVRAQLRWPVDAPRVTQDYAEYGTVVSGRYHTGIDVTSALSAPGATNVNVLAAGNGEVVLTSSICAPCGAGCGCATCNSGWGNYVVIRHNPGLFTLYAHLNSVLVNMGPVVTGQPIGIMGATGGVCGVHVHFEILTSQPTGVGDFGMNGDYSDEHPAELMPPHPDPRDYFDHIPITINDGPVCVRDRPVNGVCFTQVFQAQQYIASARSPQGWYYIDLPCAGLCAAPGASPRYGWLSGSFVSLFPGTQPTQLHVLGQDLAPPGSLPIRADPSGSATVVTHAWGGQRLITPGNAAAGSGCSAGWRQTFVPASANAPGNLGWLCSDHVELSSPAVPELTVFTGTVANAASGTPISGALLTWGMYSALSNPDGTFFFANVPCGQERMLTVTALGFAPYSILWNPSCGSTTAPPIECGPGQNCAEGGTPSGAFQPGETVYVVNTQGVGLRAWSEPCRGQFVTKQDGTSGVIIGNPQCCGGYTRWQVQWSDDQSIRWSVAGDTVTGEIWLASAFSTAWATVDCGGGTTTSGVFELSGAIGQPDAGPGIVTGEYEITGGSWSFLNAGTPVPTLDYIDIIGPLTVDENSTTEYECLGYYADGSSGFVEPDWSENSPYASISGTGLLTTYDVVGDQPCTISASYTEAGITRTDQLNVVIVDDFPPLPECARQWLPGDGLPGIDGGAGAMIMWDPDGLGPQPARLIVGGYFTIAGTVIGSNIAAWDPATAAWSALGAGMNGFVSALAADNGQLIAAGSFTTAGGVDASYVARWDGITWSPLGVGSDLDGAVRALAVLPSGELVAGGDFLTAGGVPANRVARWNGMNWEPFGAGMNGAVSTLAVFNGELIAGGQFTTAGEMSANRIARWDGATWQPLGMGVSGSFGQVRALTVYDGQLIAGGEFTTAGDAPANYIAGWDGATWQALGAGMTGGLPVLFPSVNALTVYDGELIAGGFFTTAGGMAAYNIAHWNGTAWGALGSGSPATGVGALTILPNGHLVAAGFFATAGGANIPGGMAQWDGADWTGMGTVVGTGLNGDIRALTVLLTGDVIAGGAFSVAGSVSANRIARWNGAAWSPLGTGIGSTFSTSVRAVIGLAGGDVIAGGNFQSAGGTPANNIARWNGSNWTPLGPGVGGWVYALTSLSNGDLIAGGAFTTAGGVSANRVARWNGAAWTALGEGMNSTVFALARLPNGDLLAGGGFTTAGGVIANGIARWDGTGWSALGTGMNGGVSALTTLASGDVIAGGSFTAAGGMSANYIARWNGTAWSPLGTGMDSAVEGLTTLVSGDVVAGGLFASAGGVDVSRIARWNGSIWSPLGGGVNNIVETLASLPSGDLVAGGFFTSAGGSVSAYWARWGCPGDCNSNGHVTLSDYAGFVGCITGPDAPADTGCGCYRLDGDADVDLRDFAAFTNTFAG